MAIRSTIKSKLGSSSGTKNDDLLKLLGIAEEEGIAPPEKKITALERVMGALRASETSGLAEDLLNGKPIGEALNQYKKRIGKGWSLQGLEKEDLSGVEGYKDILAKRGVSDKGIFGGKGPSAAGIGGFVGDILLDPLTYVSFGTTAAGKTASKTVSKEALEELAEGGVKTIAKEGLEEGAEQLGKEGIENIAKKSVPTLGKSWKEQAKLGQKSLLNVGGQSIVPKSVNEFVFGNAEKAIRKVGGTQLGETIDAFRKIFKDDIVKMSDVGTDLAYEQFQQGLLKRQSLNTLNRMKTEGYNQAMKFREEVTKMSKKDLPKYTSIMGDVIDAVEKTKFGEKLSVKGLDEGTTKLAEEVLTFRDYLYDIWTKVGGKDLADEEIGYWIHTLPYQTRDKIAKQFGYSAREFTDKVASDIARNYGKLTGEGVDKVGDIRKLMTEEGLEPASEYVGKLQKNRERIEKIINGKISRLRTEESDVGKTQINRFLKSETKGESLLKSRRSKIIRNIESIDSKIKYLEEQTLKGKRFPISKEEAVSAATNRTMKAIRESPVRGTSGTDLINKIKQIPLAKGKSEDFTVTDDFVKTITDKIEDLKLEKKLEEIDLDALNYGGTRKLTAAQTLTQNEPIVKGAKSARRKIDSINKRIKDLEVLKDTKISDIDSVLKNIDPNKLDRLYVKRGGEFIDDVFVPGKLKRNVFEFNNATIKEINEKFGEKFSLDLPYTTYLMSSRIGKKAAGNEYLSIIQNLGKPSKYAPEGWVKSTAPFFKNDDLVFNPEIAKGIDRTYQAYFSDNAVKDVLTIYDKMMGLWKTSVTSWAPAFHTRNFVSNVWQNWLGGVRDPRDYADAVGILTNVKKNGGLEALSDSQRKIYQSYLDNSLSGFGYFGADIEKDLIRKAGTPGVQGALKKIGNIPNRVAESGINIGSHIEDTGKLAHFINKIKNGYSPADAAESVRKYLFDYADLTGTEKNIFKRLMPFYTFTRKNLPMELEAFIKNPSDFANLAKTMRLAGYSPNRQEELPSYMREKPMYKQGDKFISGGILDVPALEPIDMIGETGPRSAEKILSKLLSPAIKVPLEISMDRNMFQGRPLSETKYVEPVQAKIVMDMGLGDALKVKKNKSKNGEVYYTTTDPVKWHKIRNIFSRFYGVPTSIGKLNEEDIGLLKGIIAWTLGVQPKTTGASEEAGVRKETIEALKKLLMSKDLIYEGSYLGKRKK